MLELLRVCWLPFLLSNLICPAHCGDLGNISDGTSGSSTDAAAASRRTDSSSVSGTPSVTSNPGNATCISRTANYITHTLPQQCLRTDRVAANTTQSSPSNETAILATDGILDATTTSTPTNATESATIASSTGTTSTESTVIPSPEPESEIDSPLDNANFLSFEEWKKQNLAKSGQSPEDVGNGRNIEGVRERPINNALESYGDEGEIDLDFSGFGGEASAARAASRSPQQTDTTTDETPFGELVPALRSKDAGKTCKERTNYASFDCAANVLKSNPECKHSSAVLVENKDSYMLNTCSANNKFFIIELCDDILIDTIVLANYEFFSSMFRHFRVSVSDRYPVKIEKWKELGTFEARNAREVQAFLVERPQIWARYLRIEFLTHYGSEYYCPVSLLRVHGTTMLEDYRHQEELARGDHSEEATLDVEVSATPALAQEPLSSTDEVSKETATAIESISAAQKASVQPSDSSQSNDDVAKPTLADSPLTSPTLHATLVLNGTTASASDELTCALDRQAHHTTAMANNTAMPTNFPASGSSSEQEQTTTDSVSAKPLGRSTEPSTHLASTSGDEVSHVEEAKSTNTTNTTPSAMNMASDEGLRSTAVANSTASSSVPASSPDMSTNNTSSTIVNGSINATRQSSPSSTVAAAPQPATQESFYKSVHKRLQKLESNSTLSLQYIEEQSRILRDAFSKVEKRQIAATSSFLTNLNTTVMAELQGFRQAYDQLWQSTVIELEGQREQYQREMLAMGSRLTLVADELVWQKRMGIVQSTLLLLCLGLVLFSRQGSGSLEMPLMQQMVHRSQSALGSKGWESPVESPSPLSRSPVSLFRRKLWRSSTEPGGGSGTDSRPESKEGPEVSVEPPTPPRREGSSEGGVGVENSEGEGSSMDEGDEAFEDVWESRSGPATPRGTREGGASSSSGEFGQGVGWLDPGASG